MEQKPKLWRLGAWMHENLPNWTHVRSYRRNLIPAAVKSWMCQCFDYMLWLDSVKEPV